MNGSDDLHYLLDEYKYRHDLIWRFVFQITVVVVLLGYLPYTTYVVPILDAGWGFLLLVPPAFGVGMAGFSKAILEFELHHFWRVVLAYHRLQNEFFKARLAGYASESAFVPVRNSDPFLRNARLYLTLLFWFSATNLIIAVAWLCEERNAGGRAWRILCCVVSKG